MSTFIHIKCRYTNRNLLTFCDYLCDFASKFETTLRVIDQRPMDLLIHDKIQVKKSHATDPL